MPLFIEVHHQRGHHPFGDGEFSTVRPSKFHRFRPLSELVEAMETYYPAELAEGIVRKEVRRVLDGVR
ncbi:hypothetical protein CQ10_38515 [Bradyrhizobium valentinum]|nr:hypothetical protein CQ10_38515 [Bradyrhizobium valentinum]